MFVVVNGIDHENRIMEGTEIVLRPQRLLGVLALLHDLGHPEMVAECLPGPRDIPIDLFLDACDGPDAQAGPAVAARRYGVQ